MYFRNMLGTAIFAVSITVPYHAANAAAVPISTSFGTLPGTEFGGDGIPADAVQIATYDLGNSDVLTLGITATPRFSAPKVGNDGAGTFTVKTGTTTSGSGLLGSTWNFSFFIGLTDSAGGDIEASIESLGLQLLYDFNPGVSTPTNELGVLSYPVLPLLSTVTNETPGDASSPIVKLEGSQNLLFGYLANDAAGFIQSPTFSTFNAMVNGEYSFQLNATNILGQTGGVAITVNAVPIPGAAPLFLSVLAAAGAYRRFKTKEV